MCGEEHVSMLHSAAGSNMPLFARFTDLPTELRLQIWYYAVNTIESRIVGLDSHVFTHNTVWSTKNAAHPLLHACRQSRDIALRTFQLRLRTCSFSRLRTPPLRGEASAFTLVQQCGPYLKNEDTIFIHVPNLFVLYDICIFSAEVYSLMVPLPDTRATIEETGSLEGYLALRSSRDALVRPIYSLTHLFPNLRVITFEMSNISGRPRKAGQNFIVDESQFEYVHMGPNDQSVRHLQESLELRYGAKLSADDEDWTPPQIRFGHFKSWENNREAQLSVC